MADSLRITVNNRKALKGLRTLEKNIGKGSARTVIKSARHAFRVAKGLVPKETGKTSRAIMSLVALMKNKSYEARIGFNRNPHPEKTWSGGEFMLPAWMTFSPHAPRHIKTGKARFLLIAAESTRKKFGKEVEVMIGNIKW